MMRREEVNAVMRECLEDAARVLGEWGASIPPEREIEAIAVELFRARTEPKRLVAP